MRPNVKDVRKEHTLSWCIVSVTYWVYSVRDHKGKTVIGCVLYIWSPLFLFSHKFLWQEDPFFFFIWWNQIIVKLFRLPPLYVCGKEVRNILIRLDWRGCEAACMTCNLNTTGKKLSLSLPRSLTSPFKRAHQCLDKVQFMGTKTYFLLCEISCGASSATLTSLKNKR